MYVNKGGRHYAIAKYLKRMGHEPIIICCNALHEKPECVENNQLNWFIKTADEINVPFVFVKGRTYSGNGKDRILNILDFYYNLMKSYKEIYREVGSPDVILGSSIHPLTPVAAIRIARKIGAKCICEFRDLWPDELISMGEMTENSIPAILLRRIEHWTYKKADALIFTMEGAPEYIKSRKWDTESGGDVDIEKVYYINNGVDLETYNMNKEKYKIIDEDLDNPETFKIIYTGMMRKANGVSKILEIAKKLLDFPNIKFLLYGAGDETDEIIRQIQSEHINNVVYKGSVQKCYVPYLLSKSDLNLLNYMNGNLFRYGCSNNKLFEYIASEKPILCTIKMNYSIIRNYNCGFEVESTEDIVKTIIWLYENPRTKSNIFIENSLITAREFDFATLTQKLMSIIDNLEISERIQR